MCDPSARSPGAFGSFSCYIFWYTEGSRIQSGTFLSLVCLIALHSAPTTKALINKSFQYHNDADKAVQETLDFLRLWSTFHFPQILRALDRIQKDVFRRVRQRGGDYGFYAAMIENRFLPASLVALEEYGIPLEIARKLQVRLSADDALDVVLERLRSLKVDQLPLSPFERRLVRDAQASL